MAKSSLKKSKKEQDKAFKDLLKQNKSEYLFCMSHAPSLDQSVSWLHMIPIVCFSSIVIMIVKMFSYTRPMSQFFWTTSTDTDSISDFFSYYKMEMIIISACIALLMILYRATTQALAIKKCYAYIPMAVYALFVILSYIFSDYKEFSLLGWNDRFEGTIPLLCYMVMLFLVINSINTEHNVKQVLIPIAISAAALSLLGLTQGLDHDFFRTVIGQKMIVPNALLTDGTYTWDNIDAAAEAGGQYLQFTFTDKQIYQTVYNINYVSFYLTLLVPLYGLLFVRDWFDKDVKIWKKVLLGVLMALLIYNLIGSESAGGYLGIGVAVIVAIVLFNKQILKWIKPLAIIVLILALVMAVTVDRWLPEITSAVKSVLGIETTVATETEETTETSGTVEPGSIAPSIDYIITGTNTVTFNINGNDMVVALELNGDAIEGLSVCDSDGNVIGLLQLDSGYYEIEDERFKNYALIAPVYDNETYYLQINTAGYPWNFVPSNGEMYFYAATQRLVKLDKIETWGFANNPGFGSGRGDIWAHSLPLLKNTLIIGTGADTFCAVYPQNDYAAKWTNNNNSSDNMYLIVDKPHNMYIHAAVGTGCISLLALFALYGIYLVQSFKLFWKRDLENDYLLFAGAGTFLGVTGFLVTGFVDDSTVSVMPLFYTMLGLGIAINMIIRRRDKKAAEL